MLTGVKIRKIRVNLDERGFLSELLRVDWEDFVEENVVQIIFSSSYPNVVRAWHRHLRGQVDYLVALRGVIKLCIYDEDSSELDELLLSSYDPQVVRIPGIYWHGYRVVNNEPAWLLYFVNRLYDYDKPDEERKPWNDLTIVPKSINGATADPRVGKPWNWLTLPYE